MIFALFTVLFLAQGPASAEQDPSVEQLLAVKALRADEDPELVLDSLPAELARIREQALAPLYEILCTGGIPAGWRDPGSGYLRLDASRLEALENSIEGLAIQRLRVFFRRLAVEEERSEFRVQAFEILGAQGSASDQRLMLRLATPLGSEDGILPRNLRTAFERALFDLVVRDRSTLGEIERAFVSAHEGLRAPLVNVVIRLEAELSLASLANMLGIARDQDAYLLAAIARAGRQVRHPVDEGVRARARAGMRSLDPNIMLCAVRAVGALEDFEAVPFLLELLEDEGSTEALAAQRALTELTRQHFRNEKGLWRRWYETERDWWSAELGPALNTIRSGELQHANRAIASLASRRFDRHRVAEALLAGMERKEPVAVALTCHALGATRSWVAVPALVDALSHAYPTVRQAAFRALGRITGLSLPPDPALWHMQVGQRI